MSGNSLMGLVLCGGQSSRMGTDKGLLTREGQTWAQRAVNLLQGLQLSVYVSIFPAQQDIYTTLFAPDRLLTDTFSWRGPLAALLTAHQFAPHADWLVLACDLPDMQPEILHRLSLTYRQSPDYECYVYEKDGQKEPLCGIYTASGLQKIHAQSLQGQLQRHSMKYVLDQTATCILSLSEEQAKAFRNYNSPADFL